MDEMIAFLVHETFLRLALNFALGITNKTVRKTIQGFESRVEEYRNSWEK